MTKTDEAIVKLSKTVALMQGTLKGINDHLASISETQRKESEAREKLTVDAAVNKGSIGINRKLIIAAYTAGFALLLVTVTAILSGNLHVVGKLPTAPLPVSIGAVK